MKGCYAYVCSSDESNEFSSDSDDSSFSDCCGSDSDVIDLGKTQHHSKPKIARPLKPPKQVAPKEPKIKKIKPEKPPKVKKEKIIKKATKPPTIRNKVKIDHKKRQKSETRRRNMSGAISLKLSPKDFSSIPKDNLTCDPCGEECRFIPFDQIKDIILSTEKYFKKDEKGFLTFLPDFEAGNPNHLEYLGFTAQIQKTELTVIKKKSDEEILRVIKETTKELDFIPPTHEPTSICVPGFQTNLRNSVAINADVRYFDWKKLGSITKFDVILMDPPWQIAAQSVTRGVNITYDQLDTKEIANMEIKYVQDNGFMFMWVIASQFMNGIKMMNNWGYKSVQTINWVKVSKTGRYMPSHGYYLQHNKETLLIGLKGKPPEQMVPENFRSIVSVPREVRQSQKPDVVYKMIEDIFPGMMYLEVFARPHNLRNGWVSIGIELPT